MPSFGLNSEPTCPECGSCCTIGYAHSRLGKWSLRSLGCQGVDACGAVYRSIWRSTTLRDMSRFYGGWSLVNLCSKVKEIDFTGVALSGFSPFEEFILDNDDDQYSGSKFIDSYSRCWLAIAEHNNGKPELKLTIKSLRSQLKHPYAYQNLTIEVGKNALVVPLSGAWLGSTTDTDVFQSTIVQFIEIALSTEVLEGANDLLASFSWSSLSGVSKELIRFVAPFLINIELRDIWLGNLDDNEVIREKLKLVVDHLSGTFDVFEIEDMIHQSKVISGKGKIIPIRVSKHLGVVIGDKFG